MIIVAQHLRWSEAVAAARAFDAARPRAIAERLVMRAAATPVNRYEREAEIDRQLIAECGVWVAGWNWSSSDGGPTGPWRSPERSLLPAGEADPGPSIDRVVAAVEDWRAFLLQLDAAFTSINEATKDQPLARAAEHAAARLLPLIVERTRRERLRGRPVARQRHRAAARPALSAAAAHSSSSRNSATRSVPRTLFSGANTAGFGGTGSFSAAM